ncbi:MAG: GNAT family N-acetyltransferase [Bacteroides sp.]
MTTTSYLTNEQLYLRAPEPEDLDVMYRIENNPELWEVSSITSPYSRYVLKQYIQTSGNDIFMDRQLRLMIIRKRDELIIGSVDLTNFDPLHTRAEVGIVVMKEYRREKIAQQTLNLLAEYCFGYLHMKQLYAYIPVDNEESIRLFSSCGFVVCGTLKDWLRTEDSYKDAFLTQLIQPS